MDFIGEHLLPGRLGHFFILLAFIFSLLSAVGYFLSFRQKSVVEETSWLRFSRIAFCVQALSILIVFGIIFYLCANHYYEYYYAYKHASKELEPRYLLACIWEGQEGSFLLWAMWQALLGLILIRIHSRKDKQWEAPVLMVISISQFFMMFMLIGIYVGDTRLGNSLFSLTRNEISAPIFSRPDYLNLIRDGMGLNVLLRNYWMVIHPPALFLGFSLCLIPFAYAIAGLMRRSYGEWVKPALTWALLCGGVLGAGIMMGGKWAYESLSFGGYWAWDPVENASLVPWIVLVTAIHTMLIYKATKHSLKATYIFTFLAFLFVLYSTFLTKSGILGDTSVHAFTDPGKAINIMIGGFVATFVIGSFWLYFSRSKNIPVIIEEERMDSRDFWMYIGAVVLMLTSLFIIVKTSMPIWNKITGSNIAPPEDLEFSYNKVVIIVSVILGLLTATIQYLRYKQTPKGEFLRSLVIPTVISAAITLLLAFFLPFTFYKHGIGFLGAIYVAAFTAVYTIVANAAYLIRNQNFKFLKAGGSIAHIGFGIMILGMLISSANKQVISMAKVNGITMPGSTDPMTKKTDDPLQNLTLIRQIPTRMADYEATFINDSAGHETGRKFYNISFEKKDSAGNVKEKFRLQPDVYVMKDNNMSSNPDIRSYLHKDIFTYISYALKDEGNEDTASFREVFLSPGDTAYYSNGYVKLDGVEKEQDKADPKKMILSAHITVHTKDSMSYHTSPKISLENEMIEYVDDTLYPQNMYLRFAGVSDDQKLKIGLKESTRLIDFVTVKSFIFPYINLVWLGIVVMCAGFIISMVYRGRLSKTLGMVFITGTVIALGYLFLFANT